MIRFSTSFLGIRVYFWHIMRYCKITLLVLKIPKKNEWTVYRVYILGRAGIGLTIPAPFYPISLG
jgi:hypothetical protein